LKEEALDRTMWRNRFGRGFGPVVWQITDDDDDHEAMCIKYYVCVSVFLPYLSSTQIASF